MPTPVRIAPGLPDSATGHCDQPSTRRGFRPLLALGGTVVLTALTPAIDGVLLPTGSVAAAASAKTGILHQPKGVLGSPSKTRPFTRVGIRDALTAQDLDRQFWEFYRGGSDCERTYPPELYKAIFDSVARRGTPNWTFNVIPRGTSLGELQLATEMLYSIDFQVMARMPNCVEPAREPTKLVRFNRIADPAREFSRAALATGCEDMDREWFILRSNAYPRNQRLGNIALRQFPLCDPVDPTNLGKRVILEPTT